MLMHGETGVRRVRMTLFVRTTQRVKNAARGLQVVLSDLNKGDCLAEVA